MIPLSPTFYSFEHFLEISEKQKIVYENDELDYTNDEFCTPDDVSSDSTPLEI